MSPWHFRPAPAAARRSCSPNDSSIIFGPSGHSGWCPPTWDDWSRSRSPSARRAKCAIVSARSVARSCWPPPTEHAALGRSVARVGRCADQHDPFVLRIAVTLASSRSRARSAIRGARAGAEPKPCCGRPSTTNFGRCWRSAIESALDAAARFGLRSLQAMLRGLVLECGEEEMTRWLALSPSEQVARWKTYHRSTVLPAIVGAVAESSEFREIRELLDEHEPVHPVMQARVRVLRETLRALPERKHGREIAADLAAINENARVQGGGLAKGWSDSSVYESFKRAAEACAGCAKLSANRGIRSRVGAAMRPHADCVFWRWPMAPCAAMSRAKRQMGVLDFNDLLRRTQRLLADPNHGDLTARLGSQIELLLVDEFQDTDPLQVGPGRGAVWQRAYSRQAVFRRRLQAIDLPLSRRRSTSVSRLASADPGTRPPVADQKLSQPAGHPPVRQRAVLARFGARL